MQENTTPAATIIPDDCVKLPNGELWKVPCLPKGMEPEAVEIRSYYFKLDNASSQMNAMNAVLDLEEKRAKGDEEKPADKEKLADIERRRGIVKEEGFDVMLAYGMPFVEGLYRLTHKDVSDEEVSSLFPPAVVIAIFPSVALISYFGKDIRLAGPDPTSSERPPTESSDTTSSSTDGMTSEPQASPITTSDNLASEQSTKEIEDSKSENSLEQKSC